MNVSASVLIVTFNSADRIGPCLEALVLEGRTDLEIVVVDNASTDDSLAIARAFGDQVRSIASPVNRGFAGGVNLAAREARGRILVLLNPDVRVHPGWLEAMTTALCDERVAVVGGKGVFSDGRIQHAGGRVDPRTGYASHLGEGEVDSAAFDSPYDVDYVSGFALATTRTVWQQLGGLEEAFYPAYFEEIDFCFRVRNSGLLVRYEPGAVFTHDQTPPSNTDLVRAVSIERQRWLFVLRHFSAEKVRALLTEEQAAVRAGRRANLAEFALVYATLSALWPRVCVARVDDPTLGGVVSRLDQDDVQLQLVALHARSLDALAGKPSVLMSDNLRGRIRHLPQPPTSLSIPGQRLRDRLARWLIKPYVDPPGAAWAEYLSALQARLLEIEAALAQAEVSNVEKPVSSAPDPDPSSARRFDSAHEPASPGVDQP